MSRPELQAHAALARGKIAALWASRRREPQARALIHYWVRVIRLAEPRK